MSKRGFGFLAMEPFYLRSKLPMQRVAECIGASNVTLKKWYKNRKAQQWRYDPVSKTIKNMNWTNYGFSMESTNLRCKTLQSRWYQIFKWQAPFLRNNKENGRVMEVHGGVDTENRDIVMSTFNGKKEQQWDLVYAKDWKGEPTTGQWNREYGFIVNKDFYIISLLGQGKYIDYVGRDLVLKTQNGRASQKWYFDQPSRTVRGRSVNQSIEIKSSGKSSDM
jgi:hypothetical protein